MIPVDYWVWSSMLSPSSARGRLYPAPRSRTRSTVRAASFDEGTVLKGRE